MRRVALVLSASALAGCSLLVTETTFVEPGADGGVDGATPDVDGGTRDAGTADAGPEDAGRRDGSTPDGGLDAGLDAGPPARIEEVVVGPAHACVIDSEGRLICWGANLLGLLATGDTSPVAAPRIIDLGASVTHASGNATHLCTQTTEPALYCWGANDQGQVGNGTASAALVTTPFRHDALGGARDVAASDGNTGFTSLSSVPRCWGGNDAGQLGLGSTGAAQPAPGGAVRDASGELDSGAFAALAERHACFQFTDRSLHCVGANASGELGRGDTTPSSVAVPVPGMTDVSSVALAASHSCAVNAGSVFCWGLNAHGQVTPGAGPGSVRSPTAVAGVGAATQVATTRTFSCALLSTGQVTCWGSRLHGGLGDGMPAEDVSVGAPVMVSGLSSVESLVASSRHLICALTSDADLYCWGEDAISTVGGPASGAATVFLDGETIHTAPVRVDPLAALP